VAYRHDMNDNADTLLGHANKLLELVELARHAALEDRARLERTIELAGRALLMVAQSQETVQQARGLAEEAEANMVFRQSELTALLAELHFIQDHMLK
jgi:hypothetical protein